MLCDMADVRVVVELTLIDGVTDRVFILSAEEDEVELIDILLEVVLLILTVGVIDLLLCDDDVWVDTDVVSSLQHRICDVESSVSR